MEREQGVGKVIEGSQRERSDSVGSKGDVSKRKRVGAEEERKGEGGSPFHRSKKTQRSPTRAEEGERGEGGEEGEEGEGEVREGKNGGLGEVKSLMERMWRDQKRGNEGLKEGQKVIEERMEEMRREQAERDIRWQEERKELLKRIEELEKRLEGVERGKGGLSGDRGREESTIEIRLRKIEREGEMKERKERRRNLIVRGVEVTEGKKREGIEKLLGDIGAEVKVEEVSRVGGGKGKEIWLVRLEKEEQKREVMRKKKFLKGRNEKITEDLTWRERKMKWRLEEIARREREEGRRVWVSYGRILIGEEWWTWDEEGEVLRNQEGRIREEKNQGEER